jgi:hypothetical protein
MHPGMHIVFDMSASSASRGPTSGNPYELDDSKAGGLEAMTADVRGYISEELRRVMGKRYMGNSE